MKRPWIQCPQCKGHGEIPMSETLRDVLLIIKRAKNGILIEQVYAKLNTTGVGYTAINNQVTTLERAGFVKRVEKKGKCWTWKAV